MKWISVEDRLPDNINDVIVYMECSMQSAWYKPNVGFISNSFGGNITHAVTHWLPLPEPPKEK